MPFAYAVAMSHLRVLERTPCFAGAAAPVLRALAAEAECHELVRGHVLWHAKETARAFHVVKSGVFKLVRPVARGRNAICAFVGAPDSIGDIAALTGRPYPTSAVVVSDRASVLALPRERITWAMRQCPALGDAVSGAIHERMQSLHHKIDVLSAGAVDARLATLLLQLYAQFGDVLEDGSLRVPIALSRQDLADVVATTFESAIRCMSRWEREDVLTTDPRGFTLHAPSALTAAAGNHELWSAAEDAPPLMRASLRRDGRTSPG
jgi:CRP/FNR family transcriptional regulator